MKLSHCKLLVFLSLALSLSVNAKVGSGSGFIVSNDGYVVTNHHVVDGADEIKVKIKGQAKLINAKVVRLDKRNDLAILKIDGAGFKPMSIQPSSSIKRGEKVYAMGFPQIDIQGVEPKLTDGIVSSLSGIRDEPTSFQITNPIQPGNSGGPLFTEDGRVIGVIVATLDALSVVKATGTIPQNVNYAIKSNYLLELLNSLDADKFKNTSQSGFRTKKFVDVVSDVEKSVVYILAQTSKPKISKESANPNIPARPPVSGQAKSDKPQLPKNENSTYEFRHVSFANVSNGVVVIKNHERSKNTFQVGDIVSRCYFNDAFKNIRTIIDVESCISMGFTRFKTVDSNSRWFFD